MKNQQTGIKEIAYELARKHGWKLEYEGGLELDGEYLDDADLTWVTAGQGGATEFVLNISWAESTAFGFVLTRENQKSGVSASSSFGVFEGADFVGTPFENASFGLPRQGNTVAEKYFISTVKELKIAVEEAVAHLI